MTTRSKTDDARFGSQAQIARMLGLSNDAVSQMLANGELAGVKTRDGRSTRWLIPLSEVDRIAAAAHKAARERGRSSNLVDDGTTVTYNDERSRAEDGDEFLDDDGFPLVGEELAQAKARLQAERAADAAERREQLKRLQASRDRQAAAIAALREQRQAKLKWLKDPNGGLAVLDALDPFTIADTLRAARRAAADRVATQAVRDAADAERVAESDE